MRGSQGSDTLFGWAGNPAYRGAQQPTDHIRYSQHSGFFGITPQDRELWLRKYPHIDDFELTVKEGHEWVSRQWDKARRAEERPREFREWWLAGEWIPMSGYREPETVYNPEQLSDFIEQYFKAGELIERTTRGKHDGFPESLARKHYEKALGHAVKRRSVAPQFPETPEATGRPYIDLRRLQEWCVECEEIAKKLYGKVKVEDIEKALQFLRELEDHLRSGFPTPDAAALGETQKRVWSEIEKLVKVCEGLDGPGETFCFPAADQLESKIQYWLSHMTYDGEPTLLLEKMQQSGIPLPSDRAELREMLDAAQWMAKTDWEKVREITEGTTRDQVADLAIDKLTEQMRILGPAKIAEEKILALAYGRYCRENPDHDKALREAQERQDSRYDGAAGIVRSQEDLARVVYLRNAKLEASFKRLHAALYGISSHRSTPDEPLRQVMEELEAIRASIGEGSSVNDNEKDDRPPNARTPGRPRQHSDEKLRLASASFEKFRQDSADDKEAWSKVAEIFEFPSWKAASQACHRYRQKQNKTQN